MEKYFLCEYPKVTSQMEKRLCDNNFFQGNGKICIEKGKIVAITTTH
jgi:hypothetical protein